MASVLDSGYELAMAHYNKLLAENRLKASQQAQGNLVVNKNDEFKIEANNSADTEIIYSDGADIAYNGEVSALSNPKIQSYIKQNRIDEIVEIASKKFNIPEQLIYKIIETESYFDKDAVSPSGAQGLMQLMPFNFATYGVTDPFDPYQNIMAGTEHLRKYIDMFDGDLKLGIAAYNAGPGNVQKYGGVPPFKETQNYIKKILGENA